MFETFHCISLLVLLNYVQMMEVHAYTWMCLAKLKCFLCLEIIPSFQWLCILVLSPVLLLSVQCRWGEIPLSSKFHPCLTGTKKSFHDSVEGTSTEIPGLQKNKPKNPGLIALWFLLRLENGNTTQLNSINFSSPHHGVVILAQKSFGLFSVYMSIFLVSSRFSITCKI